MNELTEIAKALKDLSGRLDSYIESEKPKVIDIVVDEPETDKQPKIVDIVVDKAKKGSANVRKIPIKQDNTWKYNSNSHDALITVKTLTGLIQVYAFWADGKNGPKEPRLHVCERSFPNGEWSDAIDIHDAVCGSNRLEWDSHNSIAVGQCPQTGFIFITGNHHSDRLNLGISKKPGSTRDGFTRFDDKNIVGDDYFGRMTYPSFNTVGLGDKERLVLSIRDQKTGGGHKRFKWSIMVWNPEKKQFENTHLNTGLSLRLYVSNLARRDSDGTIHLSCIWRDESRGAGRGQWTKQDLWHMFSSDGKTWKQYEEDGSVVDVKLPLIWEAGINRVWKPGVDHLPKGYDVPVKIYNTSKGDPSPDATNGQGSIVIGGDGMPYITHSADGKNYLTRLRSTSTNRTWISEYLGVAPNSEDPIPYQYSVGLIYHTVDEVRFRTEKVDNRLSKGNLNNSVSIVCDHGAFRHGYVSYQVTTVKSNKNDQGRRNSRPADYDSDVFIVTIPISELENFKGFEL